MIFTKLYHHIPVLVETRKYQAHHANTCFCAHHKHDSFNVNWRKK